MESHQATATEAPGIADQINNLCCSIEHTHTCT